MLQIRQYVPTAEQCSASTTLFHKSSFKLVVLDQEVECFALRISENSRPSWLSIRYKLDQKLSSCQAFAMHSFSQRDGSNAFPVLAWLALENDDGKAKFSVQICGAHGKPDGDMDVILEDRDVIHLDFVPSVITSVVVPDFEAREVLPGAFLVCGYNKIVITQCAKTKNFAICHDFSSPMLPQSVMKLKTQVVSCTMSYFAENKSASAFGCEDGSVMLNMNGVESRVQLDGPISCLCFVSDTVVGAGRSARQQVWTDKPTLVKWSPEIVNSFMNWSNLGGSAQKATSPAVDALSKLKEISARRRVPADDLVHLAVGGAIGFALVFEDLERKGLESSVVLTQNEEDCVLSIACGDFDLDGRQEIVLGTYGGSVVSFARMEDKWQLQTRLAFDYPIRAVTTLKEIDVVPYVLVTALKFFAVLGPNLPWLEREFEKRIVTDNEEAREKVIN